jgi:membrane protein
MSGSERERPVEPASRGRTVRRAGARVTAWRVAGRQRFAGSPAEDLWRRLTAMDLINRGVLFAATELLCLFPFLIVARTLTDQSTTTEAIKRFGLNHEAASVLTKALVPPSTTSHGVTVVSYVLFVLAGLAVAGAVQELYQATFDVAGRGLKDIPLRLVWLLALAGAGSVSGLVTPWLHDSGGRVLFGAVTLIGATCFWWFSMWLLLRGQLAWRALFPSALATGVCWLGMIVVFRLTMSDTVITDYRKYGASGVVLALVSFLIAVGVVIILGAVVGQVWRERRGRAAKARSNRDVRSTP